MEMVATTTVAGWVRGKFHDFSTDEILPPQAVDRLEEDDALLSRAIVALHRLHHYPIIATTSHTMGATASADTVTLEDGVTFAVGGVVFDTHDLDTRVLTIPDGATRFLRAEVDAACGDLVDYGDPANGVQVDPLVRRLVCKLVLSEGAETDAQGAGGGPSSPTSMRILKAVKAAAGTVPEITLYAADGLDPATSVATHKAANPAHAAAAILFDNSIAALAGAPTRVQAAIEALTNLLVLASKDLTAEIEAHAVANPAHAAGAISFDNSVAGIIGGPTRVQTAIEALTSLLMSIANDHAAQIVAHAAANPAHAAGAISFDNSIAALAGSPTRVQAALEMLAARALPLAAKLVVYVRTDGNDSHDGSANDAAHAFATIQQAVNYVCSYNLGQVGADIHIAAGTYAEGVGLPRYNSRAGVVRLLGAGIDATVISHGTSYVAYGYGDSLYILKDLSLDVSPSTGGAFGILSEYSNQIYLENVKVFGGSTGLNTLIAARFGGHITLNIGCILQAASESSAVTAVVNGRVAIAKDLVLSGGYYVVMYVSGGTIHCDGSPTISGGATGTRYAALLCGVINTYGGGASYIPGSAAGYTATGGQYA